MRVKPVQVLDSGTVAFTGLIPHDWTATGGIVWQDFCVTYGYNIAWSAQSPDGSRGVAFLPGLGWSSEPRYNCTQPALPDLQAVFLFHAQRLTANPQVLAYRPRGDLVGAAVPMIVPALGIEAPGMRLQTIVDAGEMLVGYQAADGRDMRAVMLGAGLFSRTDISFDTGGLLPEQPPQVFLTGGTEWGFMAWAPAGELDFAAADAIRRSFAPDAAWARAIADHRAVIDRGNQQTAANIAAINADAAREINGIINATHESSSVSQDLIQRESIETIRGVETYLDGSGSTVQLDNTYSSAWKLDDGSYVLTNDTMFNPQVNLGMGGQQLTVAP